MTTDNSRADALTDAQIIDLIYECDIPPYCELAAIDFARRLLLAVSQPAAAPIPEDCDVRNILLDVVPGEDGEGQEVYARNVADVERLLSEMGEKLDAAKQPAPSPVDERAAFDSEVGNIIADAATRGIAWMAFKVGARYARAASANETGAEGAIVGAWLTEDGRAISAEQKAGMLRDGGAGASSVQPYSIPCYLGAASAMAAEAVAFEITEQAAAEWASRHDVDHVLKHFSTQRNAIEDARTLHLLAAAPQPAQAGARVGLTDEQRDAIDFVIGWYEQSTIADNPYREHIAALRALLSARPAESWQVEIDAYKREVRELEAVLRIPEKIEDDWIRADVHSPTEAGIPHDDDVLAWNNDPGFATIISASFISPSFPEYTHWKKKPEAPADIDHAKGVDHAE
ncbi:gp38 [Burkholderia pseudomallei]|nr:gp38 [Burkholderia pseudomallei]